MIGSNTSITSTWREKRKLKLKQREQELDENDLLREIEDIKEYVPHVSAAKRLLREQDDLFASKNDSGGHIEQRISKSRKLNEGDDATTRSEKTKEEPIKKAQSESKTKSKEEPKVKELVEETTATSQSLLEQANQLKQSLTTSERQKLQAKEEESRILREA